MSASPQQLTTTTSTVPTVPAIAGAVLAYVVEHIDEAIELGDLARVVGLSDSNFCRQFTRDCGLSPIRWLWVLRSTLAAEFIALAPAWSLTDVAFSCGFSSSAHFSRQCKLVLGMSPSLYKRRRQAAQDAGHQINALLDGAGTAVCFHLATAMLTGPRPTALLA